VKLKGLILCSGKDTVLNPITFTIPKQLIPIGSKPLLVYTIELLLKSGITELAILVNEFSKPMFERVLTSYFKYDFYYINQHETKGIIYDLLLVEEFIKGEKFIMVLGDNYFNFDLKSFIEKFKYEETNCKILLKEVDNPERFTVAYTGDGNIIDLERKPKMAFSNWAVTGLYAFDGNIFEALKEINFSKDNHYAITSAIKWLLQKGYYVNYEILNGNWREIGNPSDLIELNIDMLTSIEKNIMGAVVNSYVSGKIILENGATLYNSTVRGPAIIGENTTIKNSYIGPYTSIGNRVNIDNSHLENSIIMDGCHIWGIGYPIDSSIIGEGSIVRGTPGVKKTYKIVVGRNSKIYLTL